MSGTIHPNLMAFARLLQAMQAHQAMQQAAAMRQPQAMAQQQPAQPGAPQQQQPPAQTMDAPWVQNLKRLVQPNVDPQAVVTPQYQNTDPGLNRLGPRMGSEVTA